MIGFAIAVQLLAIISYFLSTPASSVFALSTTQKTYRYFGYGSNVVASTMKALRQIEVREATAAVLPDFELKFASAAFVRPVQTINHAENGRDAKGRENICVVHGVLYTLTEDEFAKVGQTEGVPFGYRWQSCRVYPYRGDGNYAGMDCVNDPDALTVQAYTLVESTSIQLPRRRKRNDQRGAPSASYLGLIREGARLWKFDRSYQDQLATIQTAVSNNLLFPGGWEGPALQMAEKVTGIERTYRIDGY